MAIEWHVLTGRDGAAWAKALAEAGPTDVYFDAQYHLAYEAEGVGAARLYVARSGKDCLVYPFMLREIALSGRLGGRWRDIETVYGYSGPVATTTDGAFLGEAWSRFEAWCKEQAVIAEFVRFNPALGNERFAAAGHDVTLDRQTVVIPLDADLEAVWQDFPRSQRQKVRKGREEGLRLREATPAAARDGFQRLYYQNMQRVGARSDYFFSEAYFDALLQLESARLFLVELGGVSVAAGCFLAHDDHLHTHLVGSDERHQRLRPVNFLYGEVALWAAEQGYRALYVGGGRTPAPDDSLFVFKRSLSKHSVPFHVGRRVHDVPAYKALCQRWREETGRDEGDYFRPYHLLDALCSSASA